MTRKITFEYADMYLYGSILDGVYNMSKNTKKKNCEKYQISCMYFFVRQFLQGNELKLADMFFNPEKLHEPGMIDDLIRGMSTTSMETLDQFITDEVTNHLFEDKATPYSGLGRVSDKMSKVTIFGHKLFQQKFHHIIWHFLWKYFKAISI